MLEVTILGAWRPGSCRDAMPPGADLDEPAAWLSIQDARVAQAETAGCHGHEKPHTPRAMDQKRPLSARHPVAVATRPAEGPPASQGAIERCTDRPHETWANNSAGLSALLRSIDRCRRFTSVQSRRSGQIAGSRHASEAATAIHPTDRPSACNRLVESPSCRAESCGIERRRLCDPLSSGRRCRQRPT